jgi:hypothetical protein
LDPETPEADTVTVDAQAPLDIEEVPSAAVPLATVLAPTDQFKVIAPGVTDADVLLHTTTLTVFAVGYGINVNIPATAGEYPVTLVGLELNETWTMSVVNVPVAVAVTADAQVPEDIREVPNATVPFSEAPPPPPPEYWGMFNVPPEYVAGPLVPVVVSANGRPPTNSQLEPLQYAVPE